jgi:hypothetical protein
MLATISAIVTDLQEKGALVAPHVIEHIADKVPGDGDEGDEVALAVRLAVFDALVHRLVAGYAVAEVLSDIDSGIAAVARALLGDPL